MEESKSVIMSEQEVRKLIIDTVNTTLTQLGIDRKDPMEMQKDFQHLRAWRESTERIKSRTMLSSVGIVLAGIAAALWVGLKHLFVE